VIPVPAGAVTLIVPVATAQVGSVVALAVGAVGAVGCALIVTDVADDTQVLSEIRLVLKEWSRSYNEKYRTL
jgi:hypothetical protein